MKMKMITRLIGLLFAVAALAATETHTVSIPEQATDFTSSALLPQFDPAVGTLTAATLYVTASNNSFTQVENLNRSASTTITTDSVTASVGSLVSAVAVNSWTNTLARYDGVLDFAGTSGVSNAPVVVTASNSVGLDITTVQGTGFFTLPVSAVANSTFTGTSAYSFNVNTKASVLVRLVYEFTPDCPTPLVVSEHEKECDHDNDPKTEKCYKRGR